MFWPTTWPTRTSKTSGAPPRRVGSATERSSSPISRKRSGLERGNPGWTPSETLVPWDLGSESSCCEKGNAFHDYGQRRLEDDQGQRREIRRFPVHGSARQVAARHFRRHHDRRGDILRRTD